MSGWLSVARVHARHLVLFALVAGLLCGGSAPWLAPPLALVGALVAGRSVLGAVVIVAVLGGALLADARRAAIDGGTLPAELGAYVRERATLLEPLRERPSGRLAARARVRGEPLLLTLPDRSRLHAPRGQATWYVGAGDVLVVRGALLALTPYDEIQRRRGALARIVVDAARPAGGRRGGLPGALDGVRRRAERGLGSPLLEGMVLGRDDRIDASTQEAFRASGLAHLLAASGTNVLLLATLALAAGALLGIPLRARLLVAVALVAVYVPLAGAGPSIQRAGVMGAAGLVAALAGRPSSRVYALGLAAAVTLTLSPYSAGEAGWQLSFAAVIGLMVLAPGLRDRLIARRVPRPVAEIAAITIAASLATAPLLSVHFGRVSLISLPANLVVAPVVAPIMWLGMLAGAIAQVDPGLARPLAAAAAPLAGFVEHVASVSAAVPHAQLELALPGLLGAVAGYGLLVLAWRRPRVAAAAAAIALAWSLLGQRGRPPPAPGETVVSFLDVGQGDATLIERDGRSVLFDTGPPGGPILARLAQVGVERLDVLVTTHAQTDHEGMAIPVIDHLRPRLVINGGAGWPTAVQRALPAAAASVGARIVGAAAGDSVRAGALRIAFVAPALAVARLPPSGDPNHRALVAHLRSGTFDLWLPADAEGDVTGGLDLPGVEALKVAHHGSADPGLPAQLGQLRPQIAAIEVGRDNSYGHPTASTLSALEAVVPRVYRTDRDGTVQLHVSAERMWVTTIRH